jgi:hypothetical protein
VGPGRIRVSQMASRSRSWVPPARLVRRTGRSGYCEVQGCRSIPVTLSGRSCRGEGSTTRLRA